LTQQVPVLDLRPLRLRQKPFEHVVTDGFIAPGVMAEMLQTFPQCPPRVGPTGYSSYWGDAEYDDLISTSPAWKSLFHAVHSQAFIDWFVAQFGDACHRRGCVVDLSRATYVPFRETRADKERRHLAVVQYAPHEVWVRMDIHQAHVGYTRVRHLDHRRRLMSMLVYLSDAKINAMRGGNLVLHQTRKTWTGWGDASVQPAINRMAAFPCHAWSWHSVPEIVSLRAPRNYLQITISSSVDAWT
jgi:hypothetical protein